MAHRKRLSVNISEDVHEILNRHLKAHRLKNAVFEGLACAIAHTLETVADKPREKRKLILKWTSYKYLSTAPTAQEMSELDSYVNEYEGDITMEGSEHEFDK